MLVYTGVHIYIYMYFFFHTDVLVYISEKLCTLLCKEGHTIEMVAFNEVESTIYLCARPSCVCPLLLVCMFSVPRVRCLCDDCTHCLDCGHCLDVIRDCLPRRNP